MDESDEEGTDERVRGESERLRSARGPDASVTFLPRVCHTPRALSTRGNVHPRAQSRVGPAQTSSAQPSQSQSMRTTVRQSLVAPHALSDVAHVPADESSLMQRDCVPNPSCVMLAGRKAYPRATVELTVPSRKAQRRVGRPAAVLSPSLGAARVSRASHQRARARAGNEQADRLDAAESSPIDAGRKVRAGATDAPTRRAKSDNDAGPACPPAAEA
ncbi:hypothetical protein NUW54_g4977 [Trametes sanguinea]|uniref:Uncharacterized protein n=1 Tax=Trametes sanguinea TaxID=158606 RepID=A0ACC1PYY5_9APHY|nr:hypothetical protein NUW54_g4977 [Trametes sanguinea]